MHVGVRGWWAHRLRNRQVEPGHRARPTLVEMSREGVPLNVIHASWDTRTSGLPQLCVFLRMPGLPASRRVATRG
jgi:hypothetical protein